MRGRRYTAAAPEPLRRPADGPSWRCRWPGCHTTGPGALGHPDGLGAFERHYRAEHLGKPWPDPLPAPERHP